MKKLLTILCLVLLVSCSDNSNTPSDDEVHEVLKEFVNDFNKNTPIQMDQYTILTSVMWGGVNKRKLTYQYQVEGISLEDGSEFLQEVKKDLKEKVINSYCSQPDLEVFSKDLGVNIQYNYQDSKRNYLFSIEATPLDCED